MAEAFVIGPDSGVRLGITALTATTTDHPGLKSLAADITDQVRSISLDTPVDLPDVTALGTGHHEFIKGLESGTGTLEVLMDWSENGVSRILFNAKKSKSPVYLRWTADGFEGQKGVNHRNYTGSSTPTPTIISGKVMWDATIHVTDAPISGGGTPGTEATQSVPFTLQKSLSGTIAGSSGARWDTTDFKDDGELS
jgi:hypothetical protein